MSRKTTKPIRYGTSNVDAIMKAGYIRVMRGRKVVYYIRDRIKFRRVRNRIIQI